MDVVTFRNVDIVFGGASPKRALAMLDAGKTREEMRLALTGFYERIQPQLRRQGVQLDWSMEKLPEVSGMSSGMALALLRILQEAVTNALKHGPAKVIRITGAPGPNGGAEIRVQNDRQPGEARTQSRGNGLTNMRRRAQSLGGPTIWSSRRKARSSSPIRRTGRCCATRKSATPIMAGSFLRPI